MTLKQATVYALSDDGTDPSRSASANQKVGLYGIKISGEPRTIEQGNASDSVADKA
jgi:hypothetical protein